MQEQASSRQDTSQMDPDRHRSTSSEDTSSEASEEEEATPSRPRLNLPLREPTQEEPPPSQILAAPPKPGPHDPRHATFRKRKPSPARTRKRARRRLQLEYSDAYRRLLNRDIEDARPYDLTAHDALDLADSQHELSGWTAEEKEVLFRAVSRTGRTNLQHLAACIGSKSAPEVASYLSALRRAHADGLQGERSRRNALRAPPQHPAAAELGGECVQSLDAAARALREHVERDDELSERDRFGARWLITDGSAAALEAEPFRNFVDAVYGPAVEDGHAALLAAAQLLRPRAWLELAARVFMNPAPPFAQDNWQTLAAEGQEPAMYATCFTDFHELAKGVTRKVVSASLFQAMSRLRATDAADALARPLLVERRDVETALDILRMPRGSSRFWAEAPRRNRLAVYDVVPPYEKGVRAFLDRCTGPCMEYSEVEAALGVSATRGSRDSESPPSDARSPTDPDATLSSTELDEGVEELDEREDAALELRDMRESRREERRLWKLLGLPEPTAPDEQHSDAEIPPTSLSSRLASPDHDDWRESIKYRPEWERYDRFIPEREFGSTSRSPRVGSSTDRRSKLKRKREGKTQELDGAAEAEEESGSDNLFYSMSSEYSESVERVAESSSGEPENPAEDDEQDTSSSRNTSQLSDSD